MLDKRFGKPYFDLCSPSSLGTSVSPDIIFLTISVNSSHETSPLDASYILKKATNQGNGESGNALIDQLDKGGRQIPSTISEG